MCLIETEQICRCDHGFDSSRSVFSFGSSPPRTPELSYFSPPPPHQCHCNIRCEEEIMKRERSARTSLLHILSFLSFLVKYNSLTLMMCSYYIFSLLITCWRFSRYSITQQNIIKKKEKRNKVTAAVEKLDLLLLSTNEKHFTVRAQTGDIWKEKHYAAWKLINWNSYTRTKCRPVWCIQTLTGTFMFIREQRHIKFQLLRRISISNVLHIHYLGVLFCIQLLRHHGLKNTMPFTSFYLYTEERNVIKK